MTETQVSGIRVITRDEPLAAKDLMIAAEVIERDAYGLEALAQFLKPKTILDVGGHIGCFGLLARRYWPQAKLVACEPHPVSAGLYRANVPDAAVITAAVSYDPRKSCLMEDGWSTGGCVLVADGARLDDWQLNAAKHEITVRGVETLTLEQLLLRGGLQAVDLLKLDCEGAELDILEHMEQATAARIGFIVGEYHTRAGFGEFEKLLRRRFPQFQVIPLGMPGPTLGNFMAGPEPLLRELMQRPKIDGQPDVKSAVLCTSFQRIEHNAAATPLGNAIHLSLFNGPRVDISGGVVADYRVSFADRETGIVHYQDTIRPGMFAASRYAYVIPWRITVEENGKQVYEHSVDFRGRNVLIGLNSDALGDTLAWLPYAEEFRRKWDCRVSVSCFWAKLFAPEYPELTFLEPGASDPTVYYACFRIGAYDNDPFRCKNNWRTIALQQIASDTLDLEACEVRPRVRRSAAPRPIAEPYVAISEFSTFQAKLWNYPGGWDQIISRLTAKGYRVASISKEPSKIDHPALSRWNDRPIEETIANLQHAALYIGVSSGPAWLAWALGVPVVLISGCTGAWHEMKDGCQRVINANVCHGCFQDPAIPYDRGNWLWCPHNKKFECTRKISLDLVWEAIERALAQCDAARLPAPPRFSVLMPTRNRPQFIRRAVDAVLSQDFSNLEVVIVDNGDSIESLLPQDPRIRYCRAEAAGLPAALNKALEIASGEILTFQPDDDLLRPGALRAVDSAIGEHMWLYGGVLDQGLVWLREQWNLDYLKTFNFIAGQGVFWRRDAAKIVGGFDASAPLASDWDYWIRLGQRWAPVVLPQLLAERSSHPGQDSVSLPDAAGRDAGIVRARYARRKRVLFVAQHLSTGGLPQYLLRRVEETQAEGAEVEVIEWTHASPDYIVQRKKIQALCPVHTFFGGDKTAAFRGVLEKFQPDVIHLQELPELWGMPEAALGALHAPGRRWEIVETSHDNTAAPESKRWLPDRFEWVSEHHARSFAVLGVPSTVHEYKLEERARPERSAALRRLGLDPEQQHVLNVGLFTWGKNQGEAFEVARLLPDVQFHFVGNQAPNFEQYWRPLMAAKPANCHVWGEREDVDAFYSAMDAFLFTSLRELNPLAVKEALAWKLPVLMRRLPIYGGVYDGKVTYIDDDRERTAAQLCKCLTGAASFYDLQAGAGPWPRL